MEPSSLDESVLEILLVSIFNGSVLEMFLGSKRSPKTFRVRNRPKMEAGKHFEYGTVLFSTIPYSKCFGAHFGRPHTPQLNQKKRNKNKPSHASSFNRGQFGPLLCSIESIGPIESIEFKKLFLSFVFIKFNRGQNVPLLCPIESIESLESTGSTELNSIFSYFLKIHFGPN